MSLYTCYQHLAYLKMHDLHQQSYFSGLEADLKRIETKNDPLALAGFNQTLKARFPQTADRFYFSPVLWLPLRQYEFEQRIRAIMDEVSACMLNQETQTHNSISAFHLPKTQLPLFSGKPVKKLYLKLDKALQGFHRDDSAEVLHQKWQRFASQTILEQQHFADKGSAFVKRYQQQKYIELRQGIQNQLALSYLHQRYQTQNFNLGAQWHRGSTNYTGHGHVMDLVRQAGEGISEPRFSMNLVMDSMEANRVDSSKDQAIVKHNRLTAKVVTTHTDRANQLLALAQKNLGQSLKVDLFSSNASHLRSTFIQYRFDQSNLKIIYGDPFYGLYEFDNEVAFLFFYKMLYAKEQLQDGVNWNRYIASSMRYAPQESAQYSAQGMWRSLLHGLKYNRSFVEVFIKGAILFNLTMFASLVTLYGIASVIGIFSEAVSIFLQGVIGQSQFSILLGISMTFGSGGLLAFPTFFHALSLSCLDTVKSWFGINQHYEAILHAENPEVAELMQQQTSHARLVSVMPSSVATQAQTMLSPTAKAKKAVDLMVTPEPESGTTVSAAPSL